MNHPYGVPENLKIKHEIKIHEMEETLSEFQRIPAEGGKGYPRMKEIKTKIADISYFIGESPTVQRLFYKKVIGLPTETGSRKSETVYFSKYSFISELHSEFVSGRLKNLDVIKKYLPEELIKNGLPLWHGGGSVLKVDGNDFIKVHHGFDEKIRNLETSTGVIKEIFCHKEGGKEFFYSLPPEDSSGFRRGSPELVDISEIQKLKK